METKFNFNSQVCTDRFQSERLLALGLKPETADMVLVPSSRHDGSDVIRVRKSYLMEEDAIPAWSLHRLIEMLPPSIKDRYHYSLIYDIHRDLVGYMCYSDGISRYTNRFLWVTQSTNPFDNIIDCIEWLIKEGYFNKEYLV